MVSAVNRLDAHCRARKELEAPLGSLTDQSQQIVDMQKRVETLTATSLAQAEQLKVAKEQDAATFSRILQLYGTPIPIGARILLARREDALLVLISDGDGIGELLLGSLSPPDALAAITSGAVVHVAILSRSAAGWTERPSPEFLEAVRAFPQIASSWLALREASQPLDKLPQEEVPFARLDAVLAEPALVDFHALRERRIGGAVSVAPFDNLELLPDRAFAAPKRRSVLFMHHCYYNFFYLAKALRRRGWDAISLSTEAPNGTNERYYHGEDHRIFKSGPGCPRQAFATLLPRRSRAV